MFKFEKGFKWYIVELFVDEPFDVHAGFFEILRQLHGSDFCLN